MQMNDNNASPSILMFAPACFPPGDPEAFVNANLVMAAREAGWQIDVVTMADPQRRYPYNTDAWPGFAERYVPVAERKNGTASRLMAAAQTLAASGHLVGGGRWALPAADTAMRLAANRGYDCIISRSLPPMAHLAALITARKTGLPWIANWNDPVPLDKFPAPYVYGKGQEAPLGFFLTRYFQEVCELAAWHTFPCERLRKYISGYLPLDISGKSSVVPHIIPKYIFPQSDSKARDRKAGFILMHAGSLRPPRSSDVFLQGVRLFRERNRPLERFSAVFIVDSPEDVRGAAKAHGVEDLVLIEKSRPYTEMPALLGTADVLVIIEAMVEEGIFLPSKFVDYVGTGRPILAVSPPVGTLADILTEHGGGIAADGRRAEAVAGALQTMYECWLNGTLEERFGSEKLYHLYSSETVLKAYNGIFARIRGGK